MNKHLSDEEVKNIFTYHPPNADQRDSYEKINAMFQSVAVTLNATLPEGPGKTVAFRKLSEARMQANACVALEGKF